MRKVLVLLSSEAESFLEELIAASDFSDCSVQGVLLQETSGSDRTFPFPYFTVASDKETTSSSCSSIDYPDILKMIFEADTIIS